MFGRAERGPGTGAADVGAAADGAARQLLAEASAQATGVLEEARSRAAALVREAEDEARRLMAAAEREALSARREADDALAEVEALEERREHALRSLRELAEQLRGIVLDAGPPPDGAALAGALSGERSR